MTQTDTALVRILRIIAKEMPDGDPPRADQQLFYDAAAESSGQARERGNAGLDSLDRVEIIMAIEDEFDNLIIPDIDIVDNPSWNTAEGIAAYVESRLDQAQG